MRTGVRGKRNRCDTASAPRSLFTTTKLRVGGKKVGGLKPHAMTTIKTPNADAKAAFRQFCADNGILAIRRQNFNWIAHYEVIGAAESLAALALHPCCKSIEYVSRATVR